jgi:hypothetical protein
MRNKHLLGAAAAACIFVAPGAAWAQGGDANAGAAAGNADVPQAMPGNMAAANGAAPAAPAAAAGAADTAPAAPVVYKIDRGFPWGILGVIGLIGLLPLFRRRDG